MAGRGVLPARSLRRRRDPRDGAAPAPSHTRDRSTRTSPLARWEAFGAQPRLPRPKGSSQPSSLPGGLTGLCSRGTAWSTQCSTQCFIQSSIQSSTRCSMCSNTAAHAVARPVVHGLHRLLAPHRNFSANCPRPMPMGQCHWAALGCIGRHWAGLAPCHWAALGGIGRHWAALGGMGRHRAGLGRARAQAEP